MADIVSKKLSNLLEVDELENNETKKNNLSDLISEEDLGFIKKINDEIGLENFSKLLLIKTAQKALEDHDELIDLMNKVDDSKAARIAEVAQTALSNANDASKSLLQYSLQKEKLEVEKQKIEIKSITINNNQQNIDNKIIAHSHKDILEQIKELMNNDNIDLDDTPPLIDS
jgi:hypothetical protein